MTLQWNDAVRIIVVCWSCCLALPSLCAYGAPPQSIVTNAITIPDGTTVHLLLMEDINSKTIKRGDEVKFKVRETVQVGGIELIPADTPVIGHIVAVGHSNFAGHSGKFGLSVDYVALPDGGRIPLRGEGTVKGGSNGAVTAAATLYWGPVALLMRGWNADIHRGTMLNAYVNGDQRVTGSDSVSSVAIHGDGTIGAWSDQNPTTRRNGVTLSRVDSGGPSDAVGIKPGDVILAIADHYIYTAEELSAIVSRITPGTRIAVRYQRRSTIYDTYLIVSAIEPKGSGADLPPTK